MGLDGPGDVDRRGGGDHRLRVAAGDGGQLGRAEQLAARGRVEAERRGAGGLGREHDRVRTEAGDRDGAVQVGTGEGPQLLAGRGRQLVERVVGLVGGPDDAGGLDHRDDVAVEVPVASAEVGAGHHEDLAGRLAEHRDRP